MGGTASERYQYERVKRGMPCSSSASSPSSSSAGTSTPATGSLLAADEESVRGYGSTSAGHEQGLVDASAERYGSGSGFGEGAGSERERVRVVGHGQMPFAPAGAVLAADVVERWKWEWEQGHSSNSHSRPSGGSCISYGQMSSPTSDYGHTYASGFQSKLENSSTKDGERGYTF
jgi:hypothetical protein